MGRGKTVTHTYAQDGTYTVRAMEWDSDTDDHAGEPVLTVTEPIRTIHFTPAIPRVDQPVDMQAVTS